MPGTQMTPLKDSLLNMFGKVAAGTVTREEGAMLINHLARQDQAATIAALREIILHPSLGLKPATALHTIGLARNRAFSGLISEFLDSADEAMAAVAAGELERLKTNDARETLARQLDSPLEHARRAAAAALARGFADGTQSLKDHISSCADERALTSAEALSEAGERGVEALAGLLRSGGRTAAVASRALSAKAQEISEASVPAIMESLVLAGDRGDTEGLAAILRLCAGLGKRAARFEPFIEVFAAHEAPEVSASAKEALSRIRA